MTNVCFRTEARGELPSRMDIAIISYLLQYITRRLYVLCGYRGFEEAIRKKQMPDYPPWYIGVYNSPCSLLPYCRNIILAGTGASVQETLFPFFQCRHTQINESCSKSLINRDEKKHKDCDAR
jgi:hypothetical protein